MGANRTSPDMAMIGIETHLGRRTAQQDESLVIPNFLTYPLTSSTTNPDANHAEITNIHLLAVFDGHGSEGDKAAKAAKDQFPKVLSSLADNLLSDPLAALKAAFHTVNEQLLNDQSWDSYLSGTTAVIALVVNNSTLHVAHVGDSKLVLVKNGAGGWTGKAVTEDHNCENDAEKARVLGAGGRVEQLMIDGKHDGPQRIFKGSLPYPGITVTRSLGDAAAQRIGVISDPSLLSLNLDGEDKYVVLGTDGLWDGISVEECVSKIADCASAPQCAEELLKIGLQGLSTKKIDDNVTVVVFAK